MAIQLGLSSLLLLGARAGTGWAFYIGAFLLLFGLVVGFATIVPVVLAELFGLKSVSVHCRYPILKGLPSIGNQDWEQGETLFWWIIARRPQYGE
jgi:hypothetical protein